MPLADRQITNGLIVLARLAEREPRFVATLDDAVRRATHSIDSIMSAAVEVGQPMADILLNLVRTAPIDAVAEIGSHVPVDTAALRTVAEAVTARLLEPWETATPDEASIAAASRLVEQKVATFDELHDALVRSGRVQAIGASPDRAISKISPHDRWPALSSSDVRGILLIDRAERLLEIGDAVRAEPLARQAVGLIDQGDLHPDALMMLPDAWRVLSRCQMARGDTDSAVDSATRYLEAMRFVCLDWPCNEVLAAMANLARRLAAAQQYEQAVPLYEKAIEGGRQLLDDPLWYLQEPSDGSTISMVTTRRDAAMAAILFRTGAAEQYQLRPGSVAYVGLDNFQTQRQLTLIAGASEGLAECLMEIGNTESAVSSIDLAVGIFRDLADADPDRNAPHLWATLIEQSRIHQRLGHHDQALEAAQDVVTLLRDHARASAGAFLPLLTDALIELFVNQYASRPLGEAFATLYELLDVFETGRLPITSEHNRRQLNMLADFLDDWVQTSRRLGDPHTALELVDAAIRTHQLLQPSDPIAGRKLVAARNRRSSLLATIDRTAEAMAESQRALEAAHTLPDDPTKPVLVATVLRNMATRYDRSGDHTSARRHAEQGLDALGDHLADTVSGDPGAWRLAYSLVALAAQDHDGSPALTSYLTPGLCALMETLSNTSLEESDLVSLINLSGAAIFLIGKADSDPAAALTLFQHGLAAANNPAVPESTRHAFARLGFDLVCWRIDVHDLDGAEAVYHGVANAAASLPNDQQLAIEQAVIAVEMINAHASHRQPGSAIAIARHAEPVLRSPAYLAYRHRELGDPPDSFLATLDGILGGQPKARRRWRR